MAKRQGHKAPINSKPRVKDSREVDYFGLLRSCITDMPLRDGHKDKIFGYIRARRFDLIDQLVEHVVQDAMQHELTEELYTYTSLKAMYSKYDGLRSPKGELKAMNTWYLAERMCARTNVRLRLTELGIIGKGYHPILHHARCIVERILGDFSPSEWVENCRHGPGVALGLAGIATSGAFKYASSVYTVSPASAHLFSCMINTDPTWSHVVSEYKTRVEIVSDCDKLSFVPKNWKTDRTIGVAPMGNLYMQLGIGEMIVSRLLRAGIDLRNQENNQLAARSASLQQGVYGDDYVTLDLSMASDTVARQLVKFLLPETWYRVMNVTRTSCTLLPDGKVVRVSKFSAMGNGFTFPLESLIFYALAQAVASTTVHHNKVWVYGDDIIVPRGSALLLTEVLRWCGFSVNLEKSFYHGLFYESCGTDYLRGVPVRPVYWKSRFGHDRDIYVVVNLYRKWVSNFPSLSWISDSRSHLLQHCRNPILFGPPIVKDGTVINDVDDRVVSCDTSKYKIHVRKGIRWCKVYRTVPRRKPVLDDFAYLQAHHGLRETASYDDRIAYGWWRECKTSTASYDKQGIRTEPIRLTQTGTRRVSVS